MGKAIPADMEAAIRRLLLPGKLSLRQIAERVGCAPNTVRNVKRRGRRKPRPAGQVVFREVAPYLCVECSERAGRDVVVTFEPCVACTARGVQHPPDN